MKKRFSLPLIVVAALLLIGLIVLAADETSASARPLSSIPDPQWGTDVRVNPTSTSFLTAQRNFTLAVNPASQNVILSAHDDNEEGQRYSASARSTDAGLTWTMRRFLGPWGGSLDLTPLGDTQIVFDAAGNAYYSSLAVGNNDNGYFMLTSPDGVSWSTPVPIVVTDNNTYHYQSNLAIDQRSAGQYAGRLYFSSLVVNSVAPYVQGIWLRYSTNGGQSWSAENRISDSGREFSRSPSLAVASNGTVYLAYEHVQNYFIGNQPELYLDRSTDGGVTWGADRMIGGGPVVPVGIPDFKGRELVLPTDVNCNELRLFHYVHIAVSPLNPDIVHAVWNDGRWDTEFTACGYTGKHGDIAYSRTTDGGQTWTAPYKINDDALANGIDQYQPSVAVAADGTVGITWYDRRFDPNHYLYDLMYIQSTDDGATWSANRRVSDVSSDAREVPDYKGINDVSYRKGLVFGPGYVLPSWMDTRRGSFQGDFMVDRGVYTVQTPTVAPTSTRTQTAVPTATVTAVSTSTTVPATPPSTVTRTATNIVATATNTARPTPGTCSVEFSDVPQGHTFYAAVYCLACRGIISGYADGTFKPDNLVTRGQLAKIVSNAANFQENPGVQIFQDVPTDHTFYEWINRLTNRGYMSGYNCGSPGEPCVNNRPYFRPFANATRAQTSKIVSNAATYNDPPTGQTFEDVPPTNPFYVEIQRLASRNIMGGYNCGGQGEPCVNNRPYFRPYNNVTRGQSSKIVANTFYPNCEILVRP